MERDSILIVDDEALSNKYMENYFSDYFNVHSATSVSEALVLLENPELDFTTVVTDYYMEPETGLELLKWIKEKQPNIKRIMITGYFDNALSHYIDNKTIQNALIKPLEYDVLLELIQEK